MKLVLLGSCRNAEDSRRVEALKRLVKDEGVEVRRRTPPIACLPACCLPAFASIVELPHTFSHFRLKSGRLDCYWWCRSSRRWSSW